jgi:quinoprotein glucose dehydrogenase
VERRRRGSPRVRTGDAHLIALDPKTGTPIATFGDGGRVDLTLGLRRPVNRRYYSVTSPPTVCRNVVVVGASIADFAVRRNAPPGDVRGFDVRTGKLLWTFHSIAQEGEYGNTWKRARGSTPATPTCGRSMSCDPEVGYVYLPFGTPTSDYYGGKRPGANLFAESLVAVEVETGRRVWHFQGVHHGIWDYDFPCAPNLVEITVGGKQIKAVAQVSKQGFTYVFDRVTGEPVWPIEERPVAQSTVTGEKTSPTQPFPTRPAPFDRQGVSSDDLITSHRSCAPRQRGSSPDSTTGRSSRRSPPSARRSISLASTEARTGPAPPSIRRPALSTCRQSRTRSRSRSCPPIRLVRSSATSRAPR